MRRRLVLDRHRCAQPELELTREESRYLLDVLRLRRGAHLVVFDGEGNEADAEVVVASRGQVIVRIGDWRSVVSASRSRVHLVFALLKAPKMDWVIQKTTELGVTTLQPVSCERSVPTRASPSRLTRWMRIAREASRQSGRNDVPNIEEVCGLSDALARVTAPCRLMLDPRASSTLRSRLADPRDVAFFVGPEGGLTTLEVGSASAVGFVPVSLGDLVLRAETAAVAACAALLVLSQATHG